MAKKVTMQQIADYLGVSKYVVSKSLSGKEGVNPETREKVFKTAAKLGYFSQKGQKIDDETMNVNVDKVDTATLKKRVVLVLMPNIRFQNKESQYWGRILDGISESLESMGLGMVVLTENNVETLDTVLNPKGIVGVISIGVVSTAILLEVHRFNIPIVMVDYEEPLIPSDMVFNNSFDSSFQLTSHLIGLGHTRIEYIGNISYSRSFYDRWLGYRSALENNSLVVPKNDIDYEEEEILTPEKIKKWFENKTEQTMPTALVCSNDNVAKQIITVLQQCGVNIPGDISVTGFDNMDFSYDMSPTITTVDFQKKGLGKRAVEMLMRRVAHKDDPYEKILLTGSIILRESTIAINPIENRGGK
ncbi:LacI family DNA-binding transcriptional regulator [Metabacillus malikii]|uniref:LacI family transcriptional regulator n=1 Tax=Metabacillus malikii TaxID=1504265 RepID=A0ABT9ZBH7_9BACI|nr:LacI family DNA-binding transcriptional regulator [Metabacillus malikii]MDQ0229618.1 LacI family transcriptional regulator [Metabacillus malikii]